MQVSNPVFVPPPETLAIHRQMGKTKSRFSLLRHISVNWDKIILFSNSALILSGIAVAFFAQLPHLMFGLGLYGIMYLGLHGLAQKKRPSLERVARGKDLLEEKVNLLRKKNKQNLDQKQWDAKLAAKIDKKEERLTFLKNQIKRLKTERDGLQRS